MVRMTIERRRPVVKQELLITAALCNITAKQFVAGFVFFFAPIEVLSG